MTTVYKFKAYYTNAGVGTVQDPAPTCTVINMADDSKLADAQATTASTNMPGLYSYEYSGADGLDCVAWFKTTDSNCDVKQLASYVSEKITTNLNAAVGTIISSMASVDDVWDEALSGHTTAGSAGKVLSDAALEATLTAMKGAGWTTETLVTLKAYVDDLESRLTAARAGYLDNLNTGVALTAAGVDAILDEAVVGSYTLRQLLKVMAAALAGKATGGGTTTVTFRGVDDTSDVIVATVDANGNRSAVTLTV